MPAPTGNTNALKWTAEKTEDLIAKTEELAERDDVLYLGHALSILRTSTKQWNRLKVYYEHDDLLLERMEAVEQAFEARLVVGALTGQLKGSVVQFILRHKQEEQKADEVNEDQLLDDFAPNKAKSPQEHQARRKFIHNHALGLANAMRCNDKLPEEDWFNLDMDFVAHPASSCCIKLEEGVYLNL